MNTRPQSLIPPVNIVPTAPPRREVAAMQMIQNYTDKLPRERPEGANGMTPDDMAEKEFRTNPPFALYQLPVIMGGTKGSNATLN